MCSVKLRRLVDLGAESAVLHIHHLLVRFLSGAKTTRTSLPETAAYFCVSFIVRLVSHSASWVHF